MNQKEIEEKLDDLNKHRVIVEWLKADLEEIQKEIKHREYKIKELEEELKEV